MRRAWVISAWVVTGDSTVSVLECAGSVTDEAGNAVSIVGSDGTEYVSGSSQYTVTVGSFTTAADISGAGSIDSFEEHNTL